VDYARDQKEAREQEQGWKVIQTSLLMKIVAGKEEEKETKQRKKIKKWIIDWKN
jgi:hypothetical protein